MKKKLGRPKKLAADKRKARTEILLTDAEKAAFERAAGKSGQSLSEWIRARLREAAGLN